MNTNSNKTKNIETFVLTFTVLLGAFLLFQIQPMIGKSILPLLGGSSSVWTTSMIFFQVFLLLGYIYVHLLSKTKTKAQIIIHAILLFIIIFYLLGLLSDWGSPVNIGKDMYPIIDENPIYYVLRILLFSIGFPYFILATTSTLIQNWFQIIKKDESPYWLYSISNLGSLVAILSYPFFIEPFFDLSNQGLIWSYLFILYFFSLLFTLVLVWSHSRGKQSSNIRMNQISRSSKKSNLFERLKYQKVSWIVLPFIASTQLLAITNKITLGVASIPLLWLIPLFIYLVSFILTFSGKNYYKRTPYAIFGVLLFFALASSGTAAVMSLPLFLLLINLELFVCCMICHGELYNRKPNSKDLTGFYLSISFGGALGGIFVGLIAPYIFNTMIEYPLSLLALLVLSILVLRTEPISELLMGINKRVLNTMIVVMIFAITLFIVVVPLQQEFSKDELKIRNFYGTIQVYKHTLNDGSELINLVHGGILHGAQTTSENYDPDMFRTYYTTDSGGGFAINNHPKRGSNEGLRVGIIGLGAGVLTEYCREGDSCKYYEIDPDIVDVAWDHFTYLSDSKADIEIKIGDARIELQKELDLGQYQQFDVLVIDAFSDDSIPVHLLTKEAFELYKSHLDDSGIIAVHVSNRYLNLLPVLKSISVDQKYGFYVSEAISRKGTVDIKDDQDEKVVSQWVTLTNNVSYIESFNSRMNVNKSEVVPTKIWTDSYSNILSIMRFSVL